LPKDKKERGEVSRRDFLVGAGAVVVGGAIGAGIAYPLASGGDGATVTTTKLSTITTTVDGGATATKTVTETVNGNGGASTVTVTTTVPGPGDGTPIWQEPETTVLKKHSSDGRSVACLDSKNGKIVRVRPLHWGWKYNEDDLKPIRGARGITAKNGKVFDMPSKSLLSHYMSTYKKRVYSPNRILFPLQRVDWQPGGTDYNPQNRGRSKFKRISWDEVTTLIADEINRVTSTYTPWAILCSMDIHGEPKTIHGGINGHSCGMRLLRLYNDGYTQQQRNPDSWEGWYWGAKHFWGNGWMGQCAQIGPIYSDILKNTEMVILFGHDPCTQVVGYFGEFPPLLYYWFQECGTKLINICPDLNYEAAANCGPPHTTYNGKWIPPIANTDDALCLGIAHTQIINGWFDQDYLDTHCVGFDEGTMPADADPKDNFKDYVLGTYDGQPKDAAWASPICGITEWTIKALAKAWHLHPTTTAHREGGPMRGPYSHEHARLEAYIMGMQGLGKPGQHSYATPHNSPRWERNFSARAAQFSGGFAFAGWPGAEDPQIRQHIAKNMVHVAVLEGTMDNPVSWMGTTLLAAPVEDQFQRYYYPIPADEGGSEIHMWWIDAPCLTTCWNHGFKFIEAFRHPGVECIVGQHQWLENDMLYCDLILPINTKAEEEDIQGYGDEFAYSLFLYEGKAIEPVGESLSDMQAVAEVADKLGIKAEFMDNRMTVAEWVQFGFEQGGPADLITLDEMKEKMYYTAPAADDWQEDPAGLIEFYNDPESSPIQLPTGKLEFYSSRLKEYFPDDKERLPCAQYVIGGPESEGWYHDESLYGERCKTYPFVLESCHARWRFHAQFDDVPWFREIDQARIEGFDGYMYEAAWINPEDAAKLGIEYGDIVKIYNERGIVLGGAYVTERVRPGVINQYHGARLDPINDDASNEAARVERSGANNCISPHKVSSPNATGMVTSGFLVGLAKVSGDEYLQWKKDYPEAFARDYDPRYGPLFFGWVENPQRGLDRGEGGER
jgi:trimethylamine-N-oxide reductase (cytochrome c)